MRILDYKDSVLFVSDVGLTAAIMTEGSQITYDGCEYESDQVVFRLSGNIGYMKKAVDWYDAGHLIVHDAKKYCKMLKKLKAEVKRCCSGNRV